MNSPEDESAAAGEIESPVKSREAGGRFILWVGYGQYISMGSLALAGLILMTFRAATTSAGGAGQSTAVGFALLFAMIFGYSMWRLRRHFIRNRVPADTE
jgi:hypothetical protein